MKLSTSMMLGDSIMSRTPREWLNMGTNCGCAAGRAYIANGGSTELWERIHVGAFMAMWPWLNSDILNEISCRFYGVCAGLTTLEQLVDWIKNIEPACGECNKFDCDCCGESTNVSEITEVANCHS